MTINATTDVALSAGGTISYSIGVVTPRNATGASDTAHLSATLSDGSPLPPWLKLDPDSHTISGRPPPGTADVVVVITAKNDQGQEAQTVVHFKAGETPKATDKPTGPKDQQGSLMPNSQSRGFADAGSLRPSNLTVLRNTSGERVHISARGGLTAQIRSAHRSHQLTQQAALFRAAEQMLIQS
jgi:hypothetical protein